MSKNQVSSVNLFLILQPQIVTFCLIVFVTFINGPSYPFVGNLIWLPLGAMSLCFLLFDFKVVLAALLATHFSDFWIHSQSFFSQVTLLQSIAGVVAPMFAIASMRFFKLSNFFDGGKVVFQHLLFLAILTALFNTIILSLIHISEPTRQAEISYAVFCLKKKKTKKKQKTITKIDNRRYMNRIQQI